MFVLCGLTLGVLASVAGTPHVLSLYGACAISYLLLKLVGSTMYRRYVPTSASEALTVAVVVPVYNEDPVAFRACLHSLLGQTHPLSEIYVVDDGSSDPTCAQIANEALTGYPNAHVHSFDSNRGKRDAQAYGFARAISDIILTVDSDTILDPDCIREGLAPLADPNVQAVTGTIRAANRRSNLLTNLIDLRYVNAFLYERAAYSWMSGSVLCCCGSMSLWRRQLLLDNLHDFITQTFLGISVSYGDDRRLTNYALKRGRVVLQDTAVAYTLVPERFRHFLRQQIRWNKSFFRESLWVVRNFGIRRVCWWLGAAELVTWFAFSVSLIASLVILPLFGLAHASLFYAGYVVVMAYARSARYMSAPGGFQRLREGGIFLLAPLYGLMHVTVLVPLRIYSLATLRDGSWGTRDSVEVAADSAGLRRGRRLAEPDPRPPGIPLLNDGS